MTDARERLERAVRETLMANRVDIEKIVQVVVSAAQRELAPEPPAPLKVWPGLEGDGLKLARKAFDTAYDDGARRGLPADDLSRAARTAQTAYLWRALVASLPIVFPDFDVVDVGGYHVPRTALAALADPYDGGTK